MDDPFYDGIFYYLLFCVNNFVEEEKEALAASLAQLPNQYDPLEHSVNGEKRKSKPKIPKVLKMAPATEPNTKYMEVRYHNAINTSINAFHVNLG